MLINRFQLIATFVFLITVFAASNIMAQEAAPNQLNELTKLLESGKINKIEYYQLKNEYLNRQFDLSKLKSENRALYKAKSQIIAGSLLIPAGIVVGAGGLMYRNKPIPNSSSDENGSVITRSKTTSTIVMTAGGVTSAVGIVLICIGKNQKKKILLQNGTAHLDVGILDNGNLGAALNF